MSTRHKSLLSYPIDRGIIRRKTHSNLYIWGSGGKPPDIPPSVPILPTSDRKVNTHQITTIKPFATAQTRSLQHYKFSSRILPLAAMAYRDNSHLWRPEYTSLPQSEPTLFPFFNDFHFNSRSQEPRQFMSLDNLNFPDSSINNVPICGPESSIRETGPTEQEPSSQNFHESTSQDFPLPSDPFADESDEQFHDMFEFDILQTIEPQHIQFPMEDQPIQFIPNHELNFNLAIESTSVLQCPLPMELLEGRPYPPIENPGKQATWGSMISPFPPETFKTYLTHHVSSTATNTETNLGREISATLNQVEGISHNSNSPSNRGNKFISDDSKLMADVSAPQRSDEEIIPMGEQAL